MDKYANLAGRILLAHIFLLAGLNKITGYSGTQGYMEAMGVPGMLLPLVILLEIGGAVALIVGWQTRWAAYALALFSIVAAVIFHSNLADHLLWGKPIAAPLDDSVKVVGILEAAARSMANGGALEVLDDGSN